MDIPIIIMTTVTVFMITAIKIISIPTGIPSIWPK
jgi:hypothetical protein